MGMFSAAYRERAPYDAVLVLSLAMISVPVFWLGTLLMIGAAFTLHSFPLGGNSGWESLLLPATTLAGGMAGYYARILHTNLIDAMQQENVRTARGKGLSHLRAMLRHAMANAILPPGTLAGLDLAAPLPA